MQVFWSDKVELEGFAESCQNPPVMDKPESSTEADPGGPARPRTPAAPGSRKRPRFFHQPVITAFVRTLLGDRRTTTSTEDSTGAL
jgi:hypothetical protein